VRITLTGLPARNYSIETTTDFFGWSTLTNGLSDTNGLLQASDPNFLASPAKFYRGVFP